MVQEEIKEDRGPINDTIKRRMLSVEPWRFVGESPQIKDKESCSRTLELAKELWNLLKNFGTC
jgi:hypothetical protein